MALKQAPSLDGLKYVKGEPVDLSAIKGKKGAVVEFWATWCPPCRSTIPHLTELAHKYKDSVEFVGVTSETVESTVKTFVDKQGDKMDYAVAMDMNGSVNQGYMQEYGVSGIPHAFVVNIDGNVIWHGHPVDPEFAGALEKASQASSGPQPTVAHRYTLEQIVDMSEEQLSALSAKDLRGIAQSQNIDVSACLEKADYVEAIRAAISK